MLFILFHLGKKLWAPWATTPRWRAFPNTSRWCTTTSSNCLHRSVPQSPSPPFQYPFRVSFHACPDALTTSCLYGSCFKGTRLADSMKRQTAEGYWNSSSCIEAAFIEDPFALSSIEQSYNIILAVHSFFPKPVRFLIPLIMRVRDEVQILVAFKCSLIHHLARILVKGVVEDPLEHRGSSPHYNGHINTTPPIT